MSQSQSISSSMTLIRYGLFGILGAFVGIPLYLHLPKLYADLYQIDLGTIGIVLLSLRMLDMLVDPLIGYASDRFALNQRRHLRWSAFAMGISCNALWHIPSSLNQELIMVWFAFFTGLTYLFYSFTVINYYALGLRLGNDYEQRTRISAYREGFVLIGILLATILPTVLMSFYPNSTAFQIYGLIFLLLIGIISWILPNIESQPTDKLHQSISIMSILSGNIRLIWLYGLFFLNALPVAITSTLYLFFVEYVLDAKSLSGHFLIVYFLTAAIGAGLLTSLAPKLNKYKTLIAALLLSVIGFSGAFVLTPEIAIYFYLVCIITGFALGAELVLFPAILADLLESHQNIESQSFGIWQALNKLSLALAAGIVLPLLSLAGFKSGLPQSPDVITAISGLYALFPLGLKCLVLGLLWISPIDSRKT